MYLKAYEPELFEQVENLEILESDYKFTKSPVENIKSANQDSDRHPTLVMNNESCIAFSLYTKEMGLNHSLIIQRPFSLDHLVLINVIEDKA